MTINSPGNSLGSVVDHCGSKSSYCKGAPCCD
jgi:hypothetical protein